MGLCGNEEKVGGNRKETILDDPKINLPPLPRYAHRRAHRHEFVGSLFPDRLTHSFLGVVAGSSRSIHAAEPALNTSVVPGINRPARRLSSIPLSALSTGPV